MNFLRHEAPKIALVLLGTYILTKILRAIARKSADIHLRKLPPGVRVQQVRTVASVLTSVGVFIIFFVGALEVLSLLGLNLGPMLASAGIAGLAIGFGAQTLVHDFINGFFILLENQYDIGDVVRIAGVKGTLVVLFFMNARHSDRLVGVYVATTLFFLILLLSILTDYFSRGWLPFPGK